MYIYNIHISISIHNTYNLIVYRAIHQNKLNYIGSKTRSPCKGWTLEISKMKMDTGVRSIAVKNTDPLSSPNLIQSKRAVIFTWVKSLINFQREIRMLTLNMVGIQHFDWFIKHYYMTRFPQYEKPSKEMVIAKEAALKRVRLEVRQRDA